MNLPKQISSQTGNTRLPLECLHLKMTSSPRDDLEGKATRYRATDKGGSFHVLRPRKVFNLESFLKE